MVGYICYLTNNHVLINERRPDGTMIEKQQGMEVLDAYLSPSVSVKDWFVVRPHVMSNAWLTLSWPDKSFWPGSQVVQLRPKAVKWKCAPWRKWGCAGSQWRESKGGLESWTSKQIGVPKGAALIRPANLVSVLYQRWPLAAWRRYAGVYARNNSPARLELIRVTISLG
jgi:hypothetical protein